MKSVVRLFFVHFVLFFSIINEVEVRYLQCVTKVHGPGPRTCSEDSIGSKSAMSHKTSDAYVKLFIQQ